jgi:hypothetical protein
VRVNPSDLYASDMDILSHRSSSGTLLEPFRFIIGRIISWTFNFPQTNLIYNGEIVEKNQTWTIMNTFLHFWTSFIELWNYWLYQYERDICNVNIDDISSDFNLIVTTFDRWVYKFYINWTLKRTLKYKDKALWNSSWKIYLWQRWNNTNYFNWLIDEVRVYNRALSDSEILALYSTTK